jgi:hypothetical protein
MKFISWQLGTFGKLEKYVILMASLPPARLASDAQG